jgi:hypothetical protein
VSGEKRIGLDVHQATILVAVMDAKGKVVMESILETKAATVLEFFAGQRGTLSVTFEEGTWSFISLEGLRANCTLLSSLFDPLRWVRPPLAPGIFHR